MQSFLTLASTFSPKYLDFWFKFCYIIIRIVIYASDILTNYPTVLAAIYISTNQGGCLNEKEMQTSM
jgi:hypothetical protein